MNADALSDLDLLTLAAVAKLLHCSKAHISDVEAGSRVGIREFPNGFSGQSMPLPPASQENEKV
jgi:hypothetical protein